MGNEAQQGDIAVARHHALQDQGLLDCLLDLVQGLAQVLEGHHDLRRQQAGTQPLDVHQIESLIPLVPGDLVIQQRTTVVLDDLADAGFSFSPACCRSDKDSDKTLWHRGAVVVQRVAVLKLGGKLVLEPGHRGIDKAHRP